MSTNGASHSLLRQPKSVLAVGFACVVSFMGIGLVDPILPALAEELDATPSQVSLLFTSYLLVTACAMLITGAVASRIGPKATMLLGLGLIIIFSALAGESNTINQIVGFRAGWGLGNALFIATSLSVIVGAASGGIAGAIVLYETALGVGIALGPLVGGALGNISWRGPFFGVTILMTIAFVAIVVLLGDVEKPKRRIGVLEPLRALRERKLATMSAAAFFYNWGFFTLLAYTPFQMGLSITQLGLVFFGWGVVLALFAVFGAPRLQRRFGLPTTLYVVLLSLALIELAMAAFIDTPTVLIVAVIVAGAGFGVNNTLMTEGVMLVAVVERSVASAAYGFVRFIGGALAPYFAGRLGQRYSPHVPFYLGAATFAVAAGILATAHSGLNSVHDRGNEEDEQLARVEGLPDSEILA